MVFVTLLGEYLYICYRNINSFVNSYCLPQACWDLMLTYITLFSYFLKSGNSESQRPKLVDKGLCARDRNPLKVPQLKRGFTVRI